MGHELDLRCNFPEFDVIAKMTLTSAAFSLSSPLPALLTSHPGIVVIKRAAAVVKLLVHPRLRFRIFDTWPDLV